MSPLKKVSPKKTSKVSKKSATSNKTSQVKLIDGIFIPEEAKDILMSMYRSKIHFHEMKSFSSKERFGIEDKNSLKRIPMLKKSMEKISKIIQQAESRGESLQIIAEVNISFKK
jgi:hypothetical protein